MPASPAYFTSEPDSPAPILRCPRCGSQLIYRQTVIGGAHPPERWDYLECRTCGSFEYDHRTCGLRAMAR